MRIFRIAILTGALALALQGQFSSGSTGADGALNFTVAGTYTLDPSTLPNGCNTSPPSNVNVCNFTTINIAAGATVTLVAHLWHNTSVVWLASGAVNIAGNLNLQGANGAVDNSQNPGLTRVPAEPGPGGFPGGVGQYLNSPAQPGGGYGGGAIGTTSNPNGSNGVYSYYNAQLVPLFGGAGGGGGLIINGIPGGNGGAGGGAIRIASTTSINVTGQINAYGGSGSSTGGTQGGFGAGGVIHLIAPTLSGNGLLNVGNGVNGGVIKISTVANNASYGTDFSTPVVGGLYNPPLPSGVSSVQVVSVNGVAAPPVPSGSYLVPDFSINSSTPVSVNIATQNIPPGTIVTLYLSSENGNDSTVSCAALSGTIASSTATCSGTNYPSGLTLTNVRAVW
jgi:hypothetical protein